ncbi:MAG: energy-coupling factor transporter transmembrane component T [Polyangiaceae bacterium]
MNPGESRVDPRLRVVYLLVFACGVFVLRDPRVLGTLALSQAAAWMAVGLGGRRLARQVTKLWGFSTFVAVSYALTAEDPAIDRWVPLFGSKLSVNLGGLVVGLTMVLRILAVVLASQVARAGDPRSIAQGLSKLRVPTIVAASIDTVLALLGDGERGGSGMGTGGGRGRGDGKGKGGGRGAEDGEGEGFFAAVKRLGRGDVGPVVKRIERQIARAERQAESHVDDGAAGAFRDGAKARAVARDVGVIAGISLTMLGIKALKVLPSVPFAPGHKLVVLTPLYVAARLLTNNRMGATLTGLTMGTVAFLLGDGKYGVFEIVKHVTPGIVCDLLVPVLTANGREPGGAVWSAVGALIGACRFATIFVVTFLVQAPKVAYAFLVPGITVHTVFGALSGWVSYHLVRGLAHRRQGAVVVPDPSVSTHDHDVSKESA